MVAGPIQIFSCMEPSVSLNATSGLSGNFRRGIAKQYSRLEISALNSGT